MLQPGVNTKSIGIMKFSLEKLFDLVLTRSYILLRCSSQKEDDTIY